MMKLSNLLLAASAVSLMMLCPNSPAQEMLIEPGTRIQAVVTSTLPDSPGAVMAGSASTFTDREFAMPGLFSADTGTITPRTRVAKKYHRVIHPDEILPGPLSAGGKIELSLMSRFTFVDLASTAFSSGISQLRDTRPHYGDDAGAYGERLGAAALRQTTQSLFSYGIFAAAFHDDPHYYIKGRDYSITKRVVYAATRLIITRKDDGSSAINYPKLLGAAASNALTNAYYPDEDRGAKTFGKLYLTSMYGAVINNEVHEFLGDVVKAVFHKHN